MIEKEVFKNSHPIYKELINYGFTKNNNIYKYSKNLNNDFQINIQIDTKENITAKIIDTNFNEEYIGYKLEPLGNFASSIKQEYLNILKDIKNKCFKIDLYNYNQTNEIIDAITKKYNTKEEYPWPKYPQYTVFKNNNKWYSIIMNIEYSKIDKNKKGNIEIINVKLPNNLINNLINQKGYYKAYHMNKDNWLTITLDNQVPTNKILELINISYEYTLKNKEWLIPANPKYFDIITHIKESKDGIINYKQSTNIEVGDIIYMYLAAPYSEISYKFKAIEVNIPYHKNNTLKINTIMKIKLLKEYPKGKYTKESLKEYGINSLRGPRLVPEKLQKELKK